MNYKKGTKKKIKRDIRTPKPSLKPRINGAKVFGVRPNSPFLFKVAATGKKPLHYEAENLPDGLNLNADNGIITGALKEKGEFVVKLRVSNDLGAAERDFRIICGDKICLTPPMGWNSWYVNSLWVSQEKLEKVAEAMVSSDLINHGWTYINMDDAWQGERRPGDNEALQPNDKFPDIKKLCDKIHALGLKVGIYSTPWIGTYAGYRGGSVPNKEFDYSEYIAPEEERLEKNQIFGNKSRSRLYNKFGIYMGDKDVKQWVEWGIDYLKYDWNPIDIENAKRMADELKKCGRDIVYSLSNNADIRIADQLKDIANLWRTTGDITDTWMSISHIGFSQYKWRKFAGPGHWNDPDMLQVGFTAYPHKPMPSSVPSRLKDPEQYTQISLWSLLSAPLLLSCDLTKLDDFTLNLLTNDEVLEVDQDPLGIPADRIKVKRGLFGLMHSEVWAKDLEDGSKAVGFFNRGRITLKVSIKWGDLDIHGAYIIRDLWRQKEIGEFNHEFKVYVKPHDVFMARFIKK
ncbi:MAG: glycoside hydrolase family 27 protein [Promethearchaeota archaeon]